MSIGDEQADKILAEMVKVKDQLRGLELKMVELQARDDEHRRNIEKFWVTEWSALVAKVEANDLQNKKLETAVAVAEAKASTSARAGGVAGVAGGGGLAVLIQIIAEAIK